MKIKLNLKLFLLYLYAFVLVYHPNLEYLIKIDDFILLGGFTAIYILWHALKRDRKFFSMFKSKIFIVFAFFNVVATAYFSVRTMLAGTSFFDIEGLRIIHGLMPIFYLFSIMTINYELDSMNYTRKQKYVFIINLALIQSIIALAMYFYNPLKSIAISIYYKGGQSTNFYVTQNRLHGLCNGDYTYSLQILHSIFSLFSLCYAYFYKEKKYYLYSILILSVTALNGRSGLLIFAVGILLFTFFTMIKKLHLIKFLRFLVITSFLGVGIIYFIYKFSPNTFSLIEHAFVDISLFLSGDTGTETSHFMSMFIWPTGLNLLFGAGFRVFGNRGFKYNYFKNSDVGFVNEIFMGGIIYIIFIYSGYMYILNKSKISQKKNSLEYVFLNILLVSVFLANFKGEVFRSALLVTVLLIFPILFYKNESSLGDLNEN